MVFKLVGEIRNGRKLGEPQESQEPMPQNPSGSTVGGSEKKVYKMGKSGWRAKSISKQCNWRKTPWFPPRGWGEDSGAESVVRTLGVRNRILNEWKKCWLCDRGAHRSGTRRYWIHTGREQRDFDFFFRLILYGEMTFFPSYWHSTCLGWRWHDSCFRWRNRLYSYYDELGYIRSIELDLIWFDSRASFQIRNLCMKVVPFMANWSRR